MEQIYKKPFVSIRPDWLKNPKTGRNLEIDGYNAELQIGFEFNGAQHYLYPNDFHKSQEVFIDGIERDRYKVDRCDEVGVYLITIPYTVPIELIPKFIEFYLPEAVQARIDAARAGQQVSEMPPAPLPVVQID